jgi:hypothetical protein
LEAVMGSKPKPVNVRVEDWWTGEYGVAFRFDGKRFQSSSLFTKETAKKLAEKLQTVFDKVQA